MINRKIFSKLGPEFAQLLPPINFSEHTLSPPVAMDFILIYHNIPFPAPFHGSAKRKCVFFPQHHGNKANCRCNHNFVCLVSLYRLRLCAGGLKKVIIIITIIIRYKVSYSLKECSTSALSPPFLGPLSSCGIIHTDQQTHIYKQTHSSQYFAPLIQGGRRSKNILLTNRRNSSP